jgi:hypothetical protein
MIKTLLVLLSACLYGIAYICPIYFWWTVLIFLVPLFYCVAAKPHNIQPLTFTDGVLWSTVAFTLHLSGVLDGLFINAEGPIFLRILPPLLVLLLAITYGILWFAGTIWLSNPSLRQAQGKLLRMTGHMRLAIWVITAWLFFLWMEHCCIFMLGAWEGYLHYSISCQKSAQFCFYYSL